jgi:hypothetical protein
MQYANGIFVDDDGYSNFSLRGKKYFARKRAEADAKAKAQELEKTKAELEKTKADIVEVKNQAEQLAQQVVQNTPAPAPKSNKLPLIIGGVAVLGIVTFVLIRKFKK